MINPIRTTDFDAIRLKLASPEDIHRWSHGEVSKPETINYRTQKPEKSGLFAEEIFGPSKDWECYCGKYKKIRYKGIVCDKCGVEVTRALVRRERLGHIDLAAGVTHIWFLRGVPSKIGILLDLSVQELEKVVYFANFIITRVDENAKVATFEQIKEELKAKRKKIEEEVHRAKQQLRSTNTIEALEGELQKLDTLRDSKMKELDDAYRVAVKELEGLVLHVLISEDQYQQLSMKYGHLFDAGIGAEAIRRLLSSIDMEAASERLKAKLNDLVGVKREKAQRRLKLILNFLNNNLRPEWMVLTTVPVIPPDLRPMVALDGGRFATSDLNDLYRRVINRNNRLKQLLDLNAPEVICRNEKRMLQEAVDALIDNSARQGKTVVASTGQKRMLKSLADILKGKQGRFRQNLLGKRTDYSGRSVIVVGPHLKLDQCGLPKKMALELFKPFVMSRLIQNGLVHNVRSASRFIETGRSEVWDILEEIVKGTFVLLNRAPTLHRLGIQAFRPVLIEGKAIQIHPMVCTAFNADFDGDQMAVHVPLTEEAKAEAQELMLSSRNLLKPATGDPVVTPTQDIVWGAFYMTSIAIQYPEPLKTFADSEQAVLAYQLGIIRLQENIRVRLSGRPSFEKVGEENTASLVETSVGRIIFAQMLPEGVPFPTKALDKKGLEQIVRLSIELHGNERTVQLLDDMKKLSLEYLTRSGLSWGRGDLPLLEKKNEILRLAEMAVDETQEQYEQGFLTQKERRAKVISLWSSAKDDIVKEVKATMNPTSSVFSMIESGARGSIVQLTQIIGMKGLVTNPSGEIIELPVKGNFQEGFDVLEFFISSHGARKGLTDTALRTANAGYLTRRLVDVAQDVVVIEEDCGDDTGFVLRSQDYESVGRTLADGLLGRTVMETIKSKTGKILAREGKMINEATARLIRATPIKQSAIKIRSVLSCRTRKGTCQKCYGFDLGFNKVVNIGTAVGIIAAQSIGEPGTQLTMRTFHTGGVVGQDITQGLPRVEELFEARPPKKKAMLADRDGRVEIMIADAASGSGVGGQKIVRIHSLNVGDKAGEGGDPVVSEHPIPDGYAILVKNGQDVKRGTELTEGSDDIQELYRLTDRETTQRYIMKEIQYIYSSQGQKLNEKHIEIIVRQMFSRVQVKDSGDTILLSGDVIEKSEIQDENKRIQEEGGNIATAEEMLLGITKVSLSTRSFLSAASFQETARVLINAAVTGKVDYLEGLKENVIIGRLIPVGTGFRLPRVSPQE